LKEVGSVRRPFEDLEYWADAEADAEAWPDVEGWSDAEGWSDTEGWSDAEGWSDGETWPGTQDGEAVSDWRAPDLIQALRGAMHESYQGASDEAVGDAIEAILDGISDAEGFNFASLLNDIGRGAGKVLADPATGQIASAVLPTLGTLAGAYVGGPAGSALGGQLGGLAANAINQHGQATRAAGAPRPAAQPVPPAVAAPPPAQPPPPLAGVPPGAVPPPAGPVPGAIWPAMTPIFPPGVPAPPPPSSVAGGSPSASAAMLAAHAPLAAQATLATAMGQYGARSVGGVPTADLMRMMAALYGQAAADADEIAYLDSTVGNGQSYAGARGFRSPRALYAAMTDAENEALEAGHE
jgi:hypothetical protein